MITFINLKTNKRYPIYGCESSFSEKIWGDPSEIEKVFIKGIGWEKFKPKDWRREEIPDLIKPHTREQWVEYANKYGTICAQEFLETCDYMKPSEAYRIFNPPKNSKLFVESEVWFKSVFKCSIWDFVCRHMIACCNIYSLDIIKFEKYLAREFNYPMYEDGSMKDFMTKTFGAENSERFEKIIRTK